MDTPENLVAIGHRNRAAVGIPSKDEPTRAIVLRSTAWLAVETGEYRLAEKLAYEGLLGDPPGDIAAELDCVVAR